MGRLQSFVKKARREVLSEKGDICGLFFSHAKTQHACRLFLHWLLECPQGRTRTELGQFAKDLQAGRLEKGFSYPRSSFYRTIRKRLLQLGFLGLEVRSKDHGRTYKYVAVRQPIPKRKPLYGWSFWSLAWTLCARWNEQLEAAWDTWFSIEDRE